VSWEPTVLKVVSFILIAIAVALVLSLIASLITKALSALSLGFLNKLLGVVFAVVKCALILALLIQLFEVLNGTLHFMRDNYLEDAVVYNALRDLGNSVFPILKTWISNGADAAAAVAGAAANV
jgi:membrane protein required for colicin V production